MARTAGANDSAQAGADYRAAIDGPSPSPSGDKKQQQQQQQQAGSLGMLDYYLAFIHYFGFSINPADDTNSRYLSIRVKRAAAFASSMRLHRANQRLHRKRRHTRNQQLQRQASGASSELGSVGGAEESSGGGGSSSDSGGGSGSQTSDYCAEMADTLKEGPQKVGDSKIRVQGGETRRQQTGPATNRSNQWPRRLRLTVKFLAIGLTSFLALNHLVVLIDYVRQGSKVLTELLHEARLVITKLSALIFVVSWHQNQARVRQLLRLVRSTSVNILARESAHDDDFAAQTNHQRTKNSTQTQAPTHANPRIKALDRRILAWWLVCTSIILVHFSLSEAEIKAADHLWEWLDDYSLHTLSNATTSTASLLAMASFDNYIYTVHVYGTRLIGASIICLVCTFQVESIACLERHALGLLQDSQAAHMQTGTADGCGNSSTSLLNRQQQNKAWSWSWWWPTIWGSLDSVLAGEGDARSNPCQKQQQQHPQPRQPGLLKLDWAQQRQLCRAFYVLGESDWLQVERERSGHEPLGWLSCTLAARWRTLVRAASSARSLARQFGVRLSACCLALRTAALLQRFRRRDCTPCVSGSVVALTRAATIEQQHQSSCTNRVTPFCSGADAPPPADPPTPPLDALKQNNPPSELGTRAARDFGASPVESRPPLLRAYFNDYLARERARLRDQLHERRQRLGSHAAGGIIHSGENSNSNNNNNNHHLPPSGREVELALDALARKYELVRTVNLRIDHCFGHILLSQYLFLFLMSCIDVVFFSLSFSTNTKTKYIIVSGMILLWLPYLLLYRHASDIGLASERLLTSVRRLARLALVLQLSAGEPVGCGGGGGGGCGQAPTAASRQAGADFLARVPPSSPPAPRPFGERGALFWPTSTLWHYRHLFAKRPHLATRQDEQQQQPQQPQHQHQFQHHHTARARIFNKLDHVFKPSHLSIVGIMTMNKFFLLDFAKIVITASVMTIQFITKR